MTTLAEPRPGLRPMPALAAAAIELALAFALVAGLAPDVVRQAAPRLEVVSLPARPVVAPEPEPPPRDDGDRARGEAAPPARRNEATQVAAPPPEIAIPRPNRIETAPVADHGDDSASGAAVDGAGSGAGGAGAGTGGGGAGGMGSGGGAGVGRSAIRVAGALRDSDYPEEAARVRAAGTVFIRFTVGPDGRVSGCAVTRSSGYGPLDALTCRLAERRFRYRPARDPAGRAVAETVGTSFTWGPRE